MKPWAKFSHGDCLEQLKRLPDGSVDLIVTDPPYGLTSVNPRKPGGGSGKKGFMGKKWDAAVPPVEVWRECLRVLKPGAFAFIMSSPRQDCLARMILNLEEAGFVTGYSFLAWVYFSGFPKSQNLSKQADKRAIVECKECDGSGVVQFGDDPIPIDEDENGEAIYGSGPLCSSCEHCNGTGKCEGAEQEVVGVSSSPNSRGEKYDHPNYKKNRQTKFGSVASSPDKTAPVTEEAKQLDGAYAGMQMKPALEPILCVMKPLSEPTYLDQALDNRKGCTWLDDCRIPSGGVHAKKCASVVGLDSNRNGLCYGEWTGERKNSHHQSGRFPANVLVSDDALDDGSNPRSAGHYPTTYIDAKDGLFGSAIDQQQGPLYADSGSASRFFDLDRWWAERIGCLPEQVQRVFPNLMVPKPSKREKNAGLDGMPEKISDPTALHRGRRMQEPSRIDGADPTTNQNHHPTVKPVKLMSYLVTLGSREQDVVLDPYMGSGTTGVAAIGLKRNFLGCDLDPEYIEIAKQRIRWIRQNGLEALATAPKPKQAKTTVKQPQPSLWNNRKR